PPLIICEARATRGVLERTVAAEYLCPITATGGQSAGHIVNEIVPLLADDDRKVLYIGDCEVDGPADQIEANTRAYIETHAIFLHTFDLIELNGDDMRRDPPEVRKATLRSILAKAGLGLRFNEHLEGDGPTVFAHACKLGLEGIVSK